MDRNEQIDSVLSVFHNARVAQGRRVVDLEVDQMDGSQVSIQTTLGPAFPGQPPAVRLCTPGMAHDWIDEQQYVVRAPSIMAWNDTSTLSDALREIAQEFFLNPPTHTSPQYHPPSGSVAVGDDASLDTLQVELSELTPSELERLSKEDTDLELQQDWMPKHPDFMRKQAECQSLESECEEIAKATLSKQAEIDACQRQYQDVYGNYQKLHAAVTAKSALQQQRLHAISPQAINAAISGIKSEAEKDGDDLADQLSNKQIEISDFVTQYRLKRQAYHRAAIIEERLTVQQQSSSNSNTSTHRRW